MKKKAAPAKPAAQKAPASSPRKPGLLRKAARAGAVLVGTRVAAETGKKGVVGLIAGMGARRLIMRYPVGAMVVTGAYLAGRLYEAKREMDRKRAIKALPDQRGEPILIDEARSRRVKG
ncbi:hypothetical protein [Sphingobium cloacae]|uniref:Uncharacterized protein n=1 Tax=Sphingobium cloacae TaxID=120107 RepID=A0A1E1F6B2_9SPHN|nr:hypothetical protein [Sphingobium cloacae]BAV66049.1 hypothetical protein SCLO_1030090 [Sphingobium cloacae]